MAGGQAADRQAPVAAAAAIAAVLECAAATAGIASGAAAAAADHTSSSMQAWCACRGPGDQELGARCSLTVLTVVTVGAGTHSVKQQPVDTPAGAALPAVVITAGADACALTAAGVLTQAAVRGGW